MAVHNSPEPLGFNFPVPSSAMVKIVGNIIELHNPTKRIVHMANNPDVFTETKINKIAVIAKIARTLRGFIILVR